MHTFSNIEKTKKNSVPPTKQPMERRLVIQEASWSLRRRGGPQKLPPPGSAREGRAGPVYPMTAPFNRQPRVAHTVAMN